jgi:hypothetical protein
MKIIASYIEWRKCIDALFQVLEVITNQDAIQISKLINHIQNNELFEDSQLSVDNFIQRNSKSNQNSNRILNILDDEKKKEFKALKSEIIEIDEIPVIDFFALSPAPKQVQMTDRSGNVQFAPMIPLLNIRVFLPYLDIILPKEKEVNDGIDH